MKFNKSVAIGILIGWFGVYLLIPTHFKNFFTVLIYLDLGLFLSAFFGYVFGGDIEKC